jgi:hypothetical protein
MNEMIAGAGPPHTPRYRAQKCWRRKPFSLPLVRHLTNVEKLALISRKPNSSKLIRRQMPDDFAQPKLGRWGGPRVRGQQVYNVNLKSKGGNRRAYILARLARDRPDLAARVESGEMSAHAVAVELGWAKRPPGVRTVSLPRRAVVEIKSLIG